MTATRGRSIFDEGAALIRDFVTPAEEVRILERIAEEPWIGALNRRVQHYGFRYDYRGGLSDMPAPALPAWAEVMAERLRPSFGGIRPVQCIVNEYRPGQGIGMHADHRDFGPVVASLSLGEAWPMRFRRRRGRYVSGGLPADEVHTLPRRSILLLSRRARTDWMHGIDRADSRRETGVRLSATFRTVA